jgi:hypothetical protein
MMTKKKMLFPLDMGGTKVHTLEELKENLNVAKTLEYAQDGRLIKWLRDRGHNDEAEAIAGLDKSQEDYAKNVYEVIFPGGWTEVKQAQLDADMEQKAEQKKKEEENRRRELELAEEERQKEEERENQPPTVLVNYDGIYCVDGDNLIALKENKDPAQDGCDDFAYRCGVVWEGELLYYLRHVSKERYDLFKLNVKSGEEKKLSEMGDVRLCGVKDGILYYVNGRSWLHYFEIYTMDLATLETQAHKVISEREDQTFAHCYHEIYFSCRAEYPCFDIKGEHLYCLMHRGNWFANESYWLADINLETYTANEIYANKDERFEWNHGQDSIILFDHVDTESVCKCYDLNTRQIRELKVLEKVLNGLEERERADSGENRRYTGYSRNGSIYLFTWRNKLSTDASKNNLEIILEEFNVTTGDRVERMHMEQCDWVEELLYTGHFWEFDSTWLEVCADDFYLYMYGVQNLGVGKFRSIRFSLDTGKPEILKKEDEHYRFVPINVNNI